MESKAMMEAEAARFGYTEGTTGTTGARPRNDMDAETQKSKMFGRKKKLLVTPKDSEYLVQYLGSVRTLVSKGDDCAEKAVETIWEKCGHGMESVRAMVKVTKKGLLMKRLDPPEENSYKHDKKHPADENYGEQLFSVNRISYCSTGKKYRSIFAWIYRHELKRSAVELRVHAVICATSTAAHDLGSIVFEKFQFCFRDFKLDRKASDRILERQQSSSNEPEKQRALPTAVPLRTKMNSRPAYKVDKQPVGKTKSLAAIEESANEHIETQRSNARQKSHEAEDVPGVELVESSFGFVESAIQKEGDADYITAKMMNNVR